jgi:hypothetical protein
MGTRLHEIWATAALGELELGRGDAARAVALFEHQQQLLDDLMITDPDLSPAAELVEGYLTVGRPATPSGPRPGSQPPLRPKDSHGRRPGRCGPRGCWPVTTASPWPSNGR